MKRAAFFNAKWRTKGHVNSVIQRPLQSLISPATRAARTKVLILKPSLNGSVQLVYGLS